MEEREGERVRVVYDLTPEEAGWRLSLPPNVGWVTPWVR